MKYLIIFENNSFIIAENKQELEMLKEMYKRENIKIRIERLDELYKKAIKKRK